ncbi:MAG: hypothetical protein U0U46_06715 [Saprospiraceae bacterium]|nr:hypothetical protein [Saprospiraceae bacterium]
MTLRFFALIVGLAFCHSASAQMERTMYQVFEVDSVKSVALDLADIYDIYTWGGSSILIETNVKISFASPEILDYLIKEGRYAVAMDTLAPDAVKIYTKNRDRKPIKTPAGVCTEIPEAKIFVPDSFIWTDDKKTLTRKPQ